MDVSKVFGEKPNRTVLHITSHDDLGLLMIHEYTEAPPDEIREAKDANVPWIYVDERKIGRHSIPVIVNEDKDDPGPFTLEAADARFVASSIRKWLQSRKAAE